MIFWYLLVIAYVHVSSKDSRHLGKILQGIPEFRILRLTFFGKSASIAYFWPIL